MNKKNW